MVAEAVTDDDWLIRNRKTGDIIATVEYDRRWREHVVCGESSAIYSAGCLRDLAVFLDALGVGQKA
jgi:hypothetical protein